MSVEPYTLITGASSGIGRAIAVRLSHSQRLILHGRDPGRLEATRQACRAADEHVAWRRDLEDVVSLEAGVEEFLVANEVQVDRFVHCAGVSSLVPTRLLRCADVEQTMRVNFTSALLITSVLLRRKANRSSLKSVVFVSSIASRFGVKGFNSYAASKGALDSVMRSLAVELAPRVRVNSVLPGAITRTHEQQPLTPADTVVRIEDRVPLGPGTPEDVAAAIEFLLSDASRWITGQEVVVDGGYTVDASV